MNKVKIASNGNVSISSPAFAHPQVQQWLKPYQIGKVKGQMTYSPQGNALQFEPLHTTKHPPKVKAQTIVATSKVALYKDKVKISTSLPLTLTKEEMDLALAEENYLIERAFMLGLCRALVMDALNKEEEEEHEEHATF